MSEHRFGGRWTLIKLDLLEKYLSFFCTALQYQPRADRRFKRCYIDAFAGTGKCTIRISKTNHATIAGSAEIALRATPAFDLLHLIDIDSAHVSDLRALAVNAAPRDVRVYHDDCNQALRTIIKNTNWANTRGVAFLDPYGMTLDWDTLCEVASTKALDVWYLFPLSAVFRQAANDHDRILPQSAESIDRILGTNEWRQAFYVEDGQELLLEDSECKKRYREAGPSEIATYVHQRLCRIFKGWVSQPILLPEQGAPLFALFFASSNPNKKAVDLSKKCAQHLFKMAANKRIGRKSLASSEAGLEPDLFS